MRRFADLGVRLLTLVTDHERVAVAEIRNHLQFVGRPLQARALRRLTIGAELGPGSPTLLRLCALTIAEVRRSAAPARREFSAIA